MGLGLILVVVTLVTVVVGCGLGYAFAAARFGGELQAAHLEQQRLHQQLSTAAKQTPAANANDQRSAPVVAAASSAVLPTVAAAVAQTVATNNVQSVAQAANTSAANAQPTNAVPATSPITTIIPATSTSAPTLPSQTNQLPGSAPLATKEMAIAEASETAESVTSNASAPASQTQTWQQLIAETAARAQSDVLCMVDIDYLRQYREQYGTELGNYVSQHVENVIRDTLMQYDAVISRYEGQELVIAWPATAGLATKRMQDAREVAAIIRRSVEQEFLQIGSERLTVTVSIGLALCEAGLPGEHVIARADEALAAAKKAGRNRGYFHNGNECLPVEPLTELQGSTGQTTKNALDNQSKKSSKRVGCRERRRHERKPCSNINLIAPCTDNILPSIEVFQRVQFFDISSSGFSMVVPTVPTTNQFAVALINNKGMIFMAAEVANVRQSKRTNAADKPMLIVGCRFRQRLYPQQAESPRKSQPLPILALSS